MKGGERIMKKLLLVLGVIVLATVLFVGCLPGITPEPEEPVSEMGAVALAELDDEGEKILWSIINTGDVFIREYTLEFKVEYPDIAKDYVTIKLTKPYLEVGDMHSGDITLASYDEATPKSVSVTWELSE